MSLLLETTFGDLVLDLDVDGSPALCKNILKLAKARYYTNTLIYNIVPGKYCQMGGEWLFLLMLLATMSMQLCNIHFPRASSLETHLSRMGFINACHQTPVVMERVVALSTV